MLRHSSRWYSSVWRRANGTRSLVRMRVTAGIAEPRLADGAEIAACRLAPDAADQRPDAGRREAGGETQIPPALHSSSSLNTRLVSTSSADGDRRSLGGGHRLHRRRRSSRVSFVAVTTPGVVLRRCVRRPITSRFSLLAIFFSHNEFRTRWRSAAPGLRLAEACGDSVVVPSPSRGLDHP